MGEASYFLGDMSNSENVTQPESQPAQTNQYRSKIDTTYLRSIEGIIRIATLVSILLRKQGSDFPMSSFLSAKLPPLFLCIYIYIYTCDFWLSLYLYALVIGPHTLHIKRLTLLFIFYFSQ